MTRVGDVGREPGTAHGHPHQRDTQHQQTAGLTSTENYNDRGRINMADINISLSNMRRVVNSLGNVQRLDMEQPLIDAMTIQYEAENGVTVSASWDDDAYDFMLTVSDGEDEEEDE
jgi:hypothetical protein